MTYETGNPAIIGDYNSFIGTPTGVTSGEDTSTVAFANDTEATQAVAALVGVGFGQRGYGQTSFILPQLAVGDVISSSHWTNLRNAIENIGNHQGTSLTNLVPATLLETGDTIVAHDGVPPTNNELNSFISTLDTNRFNTDSGASMTLTTSAHTETRTTSWSSTIDTTVTATWATPDAARYFFNSGGELRVILSHSNTSTDQNIDWNNVLSNVVGTITLNATTTTQSATSAAGTVSNIGYYDLTTSNQRIYDGTNIGSGAYVSNDVFIDARYTGLTTNGARGSQVVFTITLQDQHTGTEDTVASGTIARFDVFRATTHLTGIPAPSWATTETFD